MSLFRRQRRNTSDGPVLNLAAMLDMAFQLLAFFVLTFKPQPVEYAIGLKLPKSEAVKQKEPDAIIKPNDAGPSAIEQVVVTVEANADGTIGRLFLNSNAIPPSLAELHSKMQAQITAADGGIDRVLLELDPKLKMAGVAKALNECMSLKLPNGQKLTKVSPVLVKSK